MKQRPIPLVIAALACLAIAASCGNRGAGSGTAAPRAAPTSTAPAAPAAAPAPSDPAAPAPSAALAPAAAPAAAVPAPAPAAPAPAAPQPAVPTATRGAAAPSAAAEGPSAKAATAAPEATAAPVAAAAPPVAARPAEAPAQAAAPRFDIEGLAARAAEARDERSLAAVETAIGDAAEAGLLDAVVAKLEAEAVRPGAPPGIQLALAAAYGRRGLITRQYAALVQAERAAKAPGIVFSLSAVYGRKELLASDPRASLCRLSVASDPPGAAIEVDGAAQGSAPAQLVLSALEEHRVSLSLSGYQDYEATLRLEPAAREALAPKLVPKPAQLIVATEPAGATLVLDGGAAKQSPASWSGLAPGTHKLAIMEYRKAATAIYEPAVLGLELLPGERVEKSIPLARGMAVISLDKGTLDRLPEGTELLVDGIPVGVYPFKDISLPAGGYNITARAPGYAERAGHYELGIGSKKQLLFPLLVSRLVPSGAIKVDGKKEDWAGIAPMGTRSSGNPYYSKTAGTDLIAGYMCADDTYLYWRMDFANGRPSYSLQGFQRSLQINCEIEPGFWYSALQLAVFSENSAPSPKYTHFSFKTRDSQTPVYKRQSTDAILYATGADFVEGRIKLAEIRPYLQPGKRYQFTFWVYKDHTQQLAIKDECVFFK